MNSDVQFIKYGNVSSPFGTPDGNSIIYSDRFYAPVAGEPSLGTFHRHITNLGNPVTWTVAGSPYTIDLSGSLPVGAKAVAVQVIFSGAAAGYALYSEGYELQQQTQVAGNNIGIFGIVHLSASRTFKLYIVGGTLTAYGEIVGYWI